MSVKDTDIDFETKRHIDFKHVWISPVDFDDTVLCGNQTWLAREARMSFPSSSASIASYSIFFILVYIYCVIRFRSGRVIRLWFTLSSLVCLLIVVSGKVTAHNNHLDDITASLVIGVGFALFIAYSQLNLFGDHMRGSTSDPSESESQLSLTEEEENAWFWKYFHIPRVNLLRRSARYLRKRDDSSAVPVVRCTNGSAYVNPAFEHKDVIDCHSTRSHMTYHDNYRH